MSVQPKMTPVCMPEAGRRTTRLARASAPGACSQRVAAWALLMGVCCGNASAAVVTHSTSFEVGIDYSGLLVDADFASEKQAWQWTGLQRFDAALGTLTGVTFGFYSTADLDLAGFARDGNPEFYQTPRPSPLPANETFLDALLAVDLALTLFEPAGATGYAHTARISDGCFKRGDVDPVRCDFERRQSVGLSALLGVGGVALSDFIGTDDINFFASMTSRLTGSCQDDLGDDCSFNTTGVSWKGVATVAYTYDAVVGTGGGTVLAAVLAAGVVQDAQFPNPQADGWPAWRWPVWLCEGHPVGAPMLSAGVDGARVPSIRSPCRDAPLTAPRR